MGVSLSPSGQDRDSLVILRFIKPHDNADFDVDGFDGMNKDMIKSKFVRQCHYHVQVVLNLIAVRGDGITGRYLILLFSVTALDASFINAVQEPKS